MLESHTARLRNAAWSASWQLRSVGVKDLQHDGMLADLLAYRGQASEKKRARRELTPAQKFDKLWGRAEKKRAAGKLKG